MAVLERRKKNTPVFYKQAGVGRVLLGALPALISAALLLLSGWLSARARADADFAEAIARRIYRPVSNRLGRITGLLPFSLLEWGLLLLFIVLIVLIVVFILNVIRSRERLTVLRRAFSGVLCVFSAVFLVYTLLCGVNYHRRPFSYYSGLEPRPAAVEELSALCQLLALEANELRAALPEDEAGVARIFTQGYAPVAQEAREAMGRLSERFDVLEGYYPAPKPVFFSELMSRMNITGVYSPFTMEANLNVAWPEYGVPATMCHELSHLRGFMREDEANFIAYLAGMESDDPAFRYSAVTLALTHAGNQLHRADTQRYAALTTTYGDGLQRDFSANNRYWQQYERSAISRFSTSVNDAYLRANSQADGVQSYGRMVDLLLALYRETGGLALPPR